MPENGGEVKLGWGSILQILALVAAISVAWGTLSAKQSAMETQQANIVISNTAILTRLQDISDRLSKLEYSVRNNREQGRR